MPLASSRSAAQKRAEAIDQERAAQARRHRLSMPRSFSSTTVVNQDKMHRRLSRQSSARLSVASKDDHVSVASNSKENQDLQSPPRATPYWKVAQERGSSPRMTRSAVKKKQKTDPPDAIEGGGVLLFSPTNIEAIAQNEEAGVVARENERYVQ
jgi:hypothetical protein